ncbi:MAG: hypothetical protein EOP83_07925 [Verrucomicrobiaceae bacterium]|nr:MAG: hypothetical protein EOP83_07925 [Verrucomicrobiaceae bacterium]
MDGFNKWNTNFLGRNKAGELVVYMHYPQAGKTITLRMADAVEVKPGVWQRKNHSAGFNRFPRSYPSAKAALEGMVSKGIRDKEFDGWKQPVREAKAS